MLPWFQHVTTGAESPGADADQTNSRAASRWLPPLDTHKLDELKTRCPDEHSLPIDCHGERWVCASGTIASETLQIGLHPAPLHQIAPQVVGEVGSSAHLRT